MRHLTSPRQRTLRRRLTLTTNIRYQPSPQRHPQTMASLQGSQRSDALSTPAMGALSLRSWIHEGLPSSTTEGTWVYQLILQARLPSTLFITSKSLHQEATSTWFSKTPLGRFSLPYSITAAYNSRRLASKARTLSRRKMEQPLSRHCLVRPVPVRLLSGRTVSRIAEGLMGTMSRLPQGYLGLSLYDRYSSPTTKGRFSGYAKEKKQLQRRCRSSLYKLAS